MLCYLPFLFSFGNTLKLSLLIAFPILEANLLHQVSAVLRRKKKNQHFICLSPLSLSLSVSVSVSLMHLYGLCRSSKCWLHFFANLKWSWLMRPLKQYLIKWVTLLKSKFISGCKILKILNFVAFSESLLKNLTKLVCL